MRTDAHAFNTAFKKIELTESVYDTSKTSYKKFPVVEEQQDLDLLHAFNSGERGAFATIYKTFYPNVYFFSRRFVCEADAEDITAEAFYKLWKHQKHFSTLRSIKIYLQVIARNDCYRLLQIHQQTMRKEKEFGYLSAAIPGEEDDPEEIMAASLKHIYDEIEKLPKQTRKVFKLAYIDRKKNREIADKLGLSENTVRVHKTNALRTLRLSVKTGFQFAVISLHLITINQFHAFLHVI